MGNDFCFSLLSRRGLLHSILIWGDCAWKVFLVSHGQGIERLRYTGLRVTGLPEVEKAC